MKKSIIFKSFLVILVCVMLMFTVTPVYAAADEEFEDIFTRDENQTGGNNTSNTNTNTNRNTNTNTNRNAVQNLNGLRNSTTNVSNTSNTLPNTGIEDSLPTVLLIVVFGISAVYAYKKIKDYRNID